MLDRYPFTYLPSTMKIWQPVIIPAIAAITIVSTLDVRADVKSVKSTFTGYKQSILAGKGVQAVEYLSTNTVKYYEQMKDLALYASRDELKKLSTADMMMAMLLRHRVPTKDLQAMAGKKIIIHAIDRGWIGKSAVERLSVQSVKVNNNQAIAKVSTSKKAPAANMEFYLENGKWKLDLVSILKQTSPALDALAQEQKIAREDLILSMLALVSDKKTEDPTLWEPPLKR
jgi:uncharacterized protein